MGSRRHWSPRADVKSRIDAAGGCWSCWEKAGGSDGTVEAVTGRSELPEELGGLNTARGGSSNARRAAPETMLIWVVGSSGARAAHFHELAGLFFSFFACDTTGCTWFVAGRGWSLTLRVSKSEELQEREPTLTIFIQLAGWLGFGGQSIFSSLAQSEWYLDYSLFSSFRFPIHRIRV